MKKAAPYILIVILAIVLFFLKNYGDEPTVKTDNRKREEDRTPDRKDRNRPSPVPDDNEPNRDNGLDRRANFLEYTQHAKCRMECRHITKEEVQDMLQNGTINYRKSTAQGKPCPTYALEGYTQKDNQHVRIVFAQCDTKTKVVTCIDLDEDFKCHCPGDEKK